MGTSSRELQEYGRNTVGILGHRQVYSHDVPTTFLVSPVLGSPIRSLYLEAHGTYIVATSWADIPSYGLPKWPYIDFPQMYVGL